MVIYVVKLLETPRYNIEFIQTHYGINLTAGSIFNIHKGNIIKKEGNIVRFFIILDQYEETMVENLVGEIIRNYGK